MAYDPEYGKHCFLGTLAAIIVALSIIFPPQRRTADWTDYRGNPASWRVAQRYDRFEFGYLPSFALVTQIGTVAASGAYSEVSLEGAGRYCYTNYRWVVDWQWITLFGTIAAVLVGLGFRLMPRPTRLF